MVTNGFHRPAGVTAGLGNIFHGGFNSGTPGGIESATMSTANARVFCVFAGGE